MYISHPWALVLVATLFSYLTAHCFIAVYGMAIDTIFLCFCEDCNRNDGINKPYFMSKVRPSQILFVAYILHSPA